VKENVEKFLQKNAAKKKRSARNDAPLKK